MFDIKGINRFEQIRNLRFLHELDLRDYFCWICGTISNELDLRDYFCCIWIQFMYYGFLMNLCWLLQVRFLTFCLKTLKIRRFWIITTVAISTFSGKSINIREYSWNPHLKINYSKLLNKITFFVHFFSQEGYNVFNHSISWVFSWFYITNVCDNLEKSQNIQKTKKIKSPYTRSYHHFVHFSLKFSLFEKNRAN